LVIGYWLKNYKLSPNEERIGYYNVGFGRIDCSRWIGRRSCAGARTGSDWIRRMVSDYSGRIHFCKVKGGLDLTDLQDLSNLLFFLSNLLPARQIFFSKNQNYYTPMQLMNVKILRVAKKRFASVNHSVYH